MDEAKVLEQWEEEERAVRARLRPLAAPSPRVDIARLSGREVLQAISAGELPPPPICQLLDFWPLRVGDGSAIFQGRPAPSHYNPLGTVHGGWLTALLDSALGCAVHSQLPAGKSYVTVEIKVNFVRPLTTAARLVRAEGRLIQLGRQVGTADGRLVGADGRLYAHATATCMVPDLPTRAAS